MNFMYKVRERSGWRFKRYFFKTTSQEIAIYIAIGRLSCVSCLFKQVKLCILCTLKTSEHIFNVNFIFKFSFPFYRTTNP